MKRWLIRQQRETKGGAEDEKPGARAKAPQMPGRSPEDLRPADFPVLKWADDEAVEKSLEALHVYAEAEALKANDWYVRKKSPKRRLGQRLRGLAIILTAGAGLVPILSELWQVSGVPVVRPGWSPLLLGLAALLLLLDRFLGGTSSWMRYIGASQEIGDLLRTFRFEWARQHAALAGKRPDLAQTQHMIGLCNALLTGVDRVVREETQVWASEFSGVLRQIDEAAAKAARAKALGAIEVEVSNGDQVAGTWTLRIDDGAAQTCSGKRASVTGILPGIRKVSVIGEIDGRPSRAEAAVIVPEGGVEAVSLTLPRHEAPAS